MVSASMCLRKDKMKYFLICFILILNYEGAQLLRHGRDGRGPGFLRNGFMSGCVAQTNATEADIAEIRNQTLPSRRQGMCLLSCLLNRLGITGGEGSSSRLEEIGLTILQHIEENNPTLYAKVSPILFKCGFEVASADLNDTCELARELISCGVKEGLSSSSNDVLSLINI